MFLFQFDLNIVLFLSCVLQIRDCSVPGADFWNFNAFMLPRRIRDAKFH